LSKVQKGNEIEKDRFLFEVVD